MENYNVVSLIGEGSFGRVYKANKKKDKSVVALKVITKRGKSNRELKNLRRECEIQCHLKHPNIIEMLESFETKNEIIMVTEFAQIDLHRYLANNGAMDEDKAQGLTCHLVSALYYLHSHRILHRDLKPQNILLDEDLHARLCDFGLARNMTMGTHVLTSIKGTPLYMAPELLAEKPYDHRADLWSLGCIIYETLSGQPPFCTSSIVHLLRLISREEVKWPSFLSSDCISFLQGVLEKDSSLRMAWTQILCHPFVEGKLNILKEENISSPYISPESEKTKQLNSSKESSYSRKSVNNNQSTDRGATETVDVPFCVCRKREKCSDSSGDNLSGFDASDQSGGACADSALMSSKDSINAIMQSDVDNIETDAEELENRFSIPFAEQSYELDAAQRPEKQEATGTKNPLYVTGNSNLIISNLNENLSKMEVQGCVTGNTNLVINHLNENISNVAEVVDRKAKLTLNLRKTTLAESQTDKSHRNKDLEKRKLSQNLDNFSLRLGQSAVADCDVNVRRTGESSATEKSEKKKMNRSGNDEKIGSENAPPSMLPGWDSCDESQNPPIENEEWLAFLHRSMQEILDGELDSLKQQNLVSIIVAPLRNSKASSKVIESVAQLLSLPLVLGGPPSVIDVIKNVYVEVKLVPNLVYASKLFTSVKNTTDSSSSPLTSSKEKSFKELVDLTQEEIKTASSLYELVCHLVHLDERFLTQFCDAIAILAADELLINFLSHDFVNKNAVRLTNSVLALLCCVIRELPENAELVEKVAFNKRLNLINLMKNKNTLIRTRICMLFRLLGRFSCRGLQSIWKTEIRETMEALMYDSDEHVRTEAECVLDELKHFSFYN